jgi:LCP family protein required for cell wall assembly
MVTIISNSNTGKGELDSKKEPTAKPKKENPPIKKYDKRKIKVSRLKRRILKHVWLVRVGVVLGFVVAIFFLLFLIIFTFKKSQVNYYLGLVSDFIFTPEEKVKTIDNRTNILILGKGGGNHEAPDLTDAVIFVSINHNNSSVALVSLPRDIWIPELRAKLNSAYYWGNQKEPPARRASGSESGGGLILAKSSVEKIVGQPVQYGIVIDFEAFRSVIDVLDGIEVDVKNSFVDMKYPIAGKEDDDCDGDLEFKCRYETVNFGKGVQHMNGKLALKFIRSRNAKGDEGTDFARAERQQKVILAIKEKVLSHEILFSLDKLIQLRDVLRKYTETDINISTIVILARRLLQSKENINSFVLPEDLLENPPKSARYNYLYVYIPKEKDWSEVHEWTECVLAGRNCN